MGPWRGRRWGGQTITDLDDAGVELIANYTAYTSKEKGINQNESFIASINVLVQEFGLKI